LAGEIFDVPLMLYHAVELNPNVSGYVMSKQNTSLPGLFRYCVTVVSEADVGLNSGRRAKTTEVPRYSLP
jgi:hypothetical protein